MFIHRALLSPRPDSMENGGQSDGPFDSSILFHTIRAGMDKSFTYKCSVWMQHTFEHLALPIVPNVIQARTDAGFVYE
jgi:hypothetical protein